MSRPRDTYVFDIADARRGAALNRMCSSLRVADRRERFLADESAYVDAYGLDPQQISAVLDRDWTAMLELGGSIFCIYKLARVDQRSMQYLGGVFSGMGEPEFSAAMRSGGRSFG